MDWTIVIGSVATLVLTVLSYYLKKLIDGAIAKNVDNEALQCLLEGMAVAQEDLVRTAKAAAEDGKLTKEEIEAAKLIAWNHAKEIATGPAKEIVLSWTKERVASLIKQLLSKTKKTA
jgi:hypothetical protein